jgi:hypothetical protein
MYAARMYAARSFAGRNLTAGNQLMRAGEPNGSNAMP